MSEDQNNRGVERGGRGVGNVVAIFETIGMGIKPQSQLIY